MIDNKIRNIIVDAGKNTIKVGEITSNGEITYLSSFPSKIKKVMNTIVDFSDVDDKSFFVEYGNRKYLVGETGTEYDFSRNKKSNHHRICTYTAISNLVENGDTINLIIGSPYNDVTNKSKEIKDFYKSSGRITITTNGETKTFSIFDVFVYSEGLATVQRMGHKLTNSVDIGGQTVNNYELSGKNAIFKGADYDFGINNLYSKIETQVQTFLGAGYNLSEKDILSIIETGGAFEGLSIEQSEELNTIITIFVEDLVQSILKYNNKIYSSKVIFTGGGSIILKKYILNELVNNLDVPKANLVFAQSVYDNIFSYAFAFLKDVSPDMEQYRQRGAYLFNNIKTQLEHPQNNKIKNSKTKVTNP